jgi:hypothetical protein
MEPLRAAMAAVDAYDNERGIFQARFGVGERPALIVIDVADGWTNPAYAGGSGRLDPAIGELLRWRARRACRSSTPPRRRRVRC